METVKEISYDNIKSDISKSLNGKESVENENINGGKIKANDHEEKDNEKLPIDMSQQRNIHGNLVNKYKNTSLQKPIISDPADGKFYANHPLWQHVKMNRNGIYSTNVGELSCFGPIFRLHYTEEIRVNMCLFCYIHIYI